MSKYDYYLEDIKRSESDDNDIHVAIISTYDHLACVKVYGTDDQLTDRLIKVLEGLNRSD